MSAARELEIAVVVPAFRAGRTVAQVLRQIPARVRHVVVVEDGSDDDTATAALAVEDPRVRVVRHRANQGVGGAMLTGYATALQLGADVVVKIDADGQMDPGDLTHLLAPIARGQADFTKGNRFLFAFPPLRMPLVRMLGNLGLTFLTKLASGYWNVFDPTNGYTAIHASVLRRLDPGAIARGYFFETSLLLELRRLGAVVQDVALPARYAQESSSMWLPGVLATFPPRLLLGFLRRLGRQYFLYDFSPASVMALLGVPLLTAGAVWSAVQWYVHASEGRLASTGTVLLGVLPIILGVQLLLQALALDIGSVPVTPLHPRLGAEPDPAAPSGLAGLLERQADLILPVGAGARAAVRIVHVLHDFLPRYRAGAELYVLHLGGVQSARHEVSVLCAEYDPTRPHGSVLRREHAGLDVHEVANAWDFETFEETWRSPLLGERARQVLRDLRPDIVHVHNLLTLTLELPAIAADLGIPVVATLHDHALVCPSGGTRAHLAERHVCDVVDPARCARCIPDAPLHRLRALRGITRRAGRALPLVAAGRRSAPRLFALAERAAARLAETGPGPTEADVRLRLDGARRAAERVSRFAAPSRALRDALVAEGVVPGERVKVWPYGLPPLEVIRKPAEDGRVRIGYVGTLAWHKGVHVLVEAAARLPSGRAVLRLHGSEQVAPEYVADLRRRAGDLDLRLEGGFREEERGRIYGGLDLLVVPSVWPEVFGIVVQEARLAGLPVIASRTGGLPELVRDGEDGLLVEPGSVDALALALRRVVLDADLRARLGSAPPRVRSLADDAAAWDRTYAEVVAEGPRPAAARAGRRIVAVLVCFRAPARCIAAVRALVSSSRRIDGVVVVDNGGADVATLRAALPEATVLATAENLGFAGGANVGVRAALAAGADAVLLLNDDAALAPDALARLDAALDAPGVGLVGPAVVSAGDRDTVESLGLSFRASTGRMHELGHGASHAAVAGQAPRDVAGLTGCALLVRREVLEQVGALDERFFFYFEDLELCLRAGRAGWRAVVVPAAVVYHEGSATIGRRSARRLYHAVRGHLRLGASLGGAGAPLRQALITGRNVAHAVLRRSEFEPGALREVLRGVLDHLRDRPHRE